MNFPGDFPLNFWPPPYPCKTTGRTLFRVRPALFNQFFEPSLNEKTQSGNEDDFYIIPPMPPIPP